MRRPLFALVPVTLILAACGGDDTTTPTDGGVLPDGSVGPDGSQTNDGGPIGDGSVSAPVCTPALTAVDVSKPTTVVGTGTPASCTESALDAAIQKAGIITFDCGAAPATITITSEKKLKTNADTTIDGGGKVTLDGKNATRLLSFVDGNYRTSKVTVTLQNLAFTGGKSSGTAIPAAPAPCSQGTDVDGGGSVIFVRNGLLHVIKSTFKNNAAPPLGPDVGGAIYALGSLGVVVQDSVFDGNTGSNGAGIYMLNSDLTVVGSTFTNNKALGTGGNTIDKGKCPSTTSGEVGSGGSGAAITIDGGSDGALLICGSTFSGNSATALAGAIFRTPDNAVQTSTIRASTFDGNTCPTGGGGALYFHHSNLVIESTTFSNNSAKGAGAIQSDDTTFTFTNDTFFGNSATAGIGGAISHFNGAPGGTIASTTFASNKAEGGSGLFAAAIAGNTAYVMTNDLFVDNTSKDCGAPMACQTKPGGGGANLQWPDKHVVCATADSACGTGTTFADPKVGQLADNGGPTKTVLPQAGSPAIGAGKGCPALDQRGNARKSPDGCTIGAVEAP